MMLEAVKQYTDLFKSLDNFLPGNEMPWVKEFRNEAVQGFLKTGFPTQKNERWKYISLKPFFSESFELKKTTHPKINLTKDTQVDSIAHLVFVDGIFSKNNSTLSKLPEGIKLFGFSDLNTSIKTHLEEVLKAAVLAQNGFTLLNLALMSDIFFMDVSSSVCLEKPIHVTFFQTQKGHSSLPFMYVKLSENSKIHWIETTQGTLPKYFHNAFFYAELLKKSCLSYTKIQTSSSYHLNQSYVKVGEKAVFKSFIFSKGGKLVRNTMDVDLSCEGAQTNLSGLSLIEDKEQVDTSVTVIHRKSATKSDQNFKQVLNGESVGVFDGKIEVLKNASNCEAHQLNRNLVLSDDAKVYSKPHLEIYHDQVQCSHGSSTGKLDDEKVYYLRSRGLSEEVAKKIILYAFAMDLQYPSNEVSSIVSQLFKKWLKEENNEFL